MSLVPRPKFLIGRVGGRRGEKRKEGVQVCCVARMHECVAICAWVCESVNLSVYKCMCVFEGV